MNTKTAQRAYRGVDLTSRRTRNNRGQGVTHYSYRILLESRIGSRYEDLLGDDTLAVIKSDINRMLNSGQYVAIEGRIEKVA